MSGKPAARQGDMTQYGGSIVQGSAGVRIGAPTGVACSVCPGGVTSGSSPISITQIKQPIRPNKLKRIVNICFNFDEISWKKGIIMFL